MSWCVRNSNGDGSWYCHPYWVPGATEFPHAQPGHWPANYPPSLSGPGNHFPPGYGAPNPTPPPPDIPDQPPITGDPDVPPADDPGEGPITGDPPPADPCEPVMLAQDYLESYLFRGDRGGEGIGRQHGNTVDQASMPIVGGLSFANLWDGHDPVYDHKPRFEFKVGEATIRVFHEGQGPGAAVLHSPQLDDYMLWGSGETGKASRYPTTISPGVLLLLNRNRGDGSTGDDPKYLLAFGALLKTTHKPGLGVYFDYDRTTRVLNIQHTDAAGADEAVADGVTFDGQPIGSGAEEAEVVTSDDAVGATHMVDLTALEGYAGGNLDVRFEVELEGRCEDDGAGTAPLTGDGVTARMVGAFKIRSGTVTQVGATVYPDGEGDASWAAWLAAISGNFYFDITSTTVSVNVKGVDQTAAAYTFKTRLHPPLILEP
jgi:hypothetical protein